MVTHDADFAELATLRGAPPKVVLLRCANVTVAETEILLRRHAAAILALGDGGPAVCLEIY